MFQTQTGSTGHLARYLQPYLASAWKVSNPNGLHRPFSHGVVARDELEKHYSGTFPQGHFPGNFPPNGMMANNVPMTHFSPEAFSQEFSLEQPTLRALPALM